MLDNMPAAYIAGLQVTGHRATSTDKDQIAEATAALQKQKGILAGYNSTNYPQLRHRRRLRAERRLTAVQHHRGRLRGG
ncbi:hypothetical protein AB0E08_00745 [Streptomyces sp. NPDC048281]|uniref:hypothetical protein n=1 Tax=Streptomyces sp. NPDC048281 TaxID=3154715 RepID=UPI00344859E5